jgi:hypothetical protein
LDEIDEIDGPSIPIVVLPELEQEHSTKALKSLRKDRKIAYNKAATSSIILSAYLPEIRALRNIAA